MEKTTKFKVTIILDVAEQEIEDMQHNAQKLMQVNKDRFEANQTCCACETQPGVPSSIVPFDSNYQCRNLQYASRKIN